MIRVLNVMGGLELGGAETTVMNYYRYIDRTKVQFDFLITIDEKNYYEDEAISLGARIFRRPMRTRNPIKNARKLAKVLAENPEIRTVHIHNSSSVVAIDCLIAMLRKLPIRVVHSHSALSSKSLIHRAFQPLIRFATTHWVGCSVEAGRSMFGEKAWDCTNKAQIFMNARDLEFFRYNPDQRQQMRKRLQICNQLVVIHVGRLVAPKNQTFLLEAFSQAVKTKPDMILLIAGDGELHAQLVSKASELNLSGNIRFLGMRGDIPDLLQVADIFVLPSLYEGLPGVAIEAQAAGLPCLLSDTVSSESKITDLVGFLPINKGPEIWAERMLAYSDFNRRDTLEDVRKSGYDIRDEAKRLENFYLCQTNK